MAEGVARRGVTGGRSSTRTCTTQKSRYPLQILYIYIYIYIYIYKSKARSANGADKAREGVKESERECSKGGDDGRLARKTQFIIYIIIL